MNKTIIMINREGKQGLSDDTLIGSRMGSGGGFGFIFKG
jgi:hypothetical protein